MICKVPTDILVAWQWTNQKTLESPKDERVISTACSTYQNFKSIV